MPQDEKNTLSAYKESILGDREINLSDCPACVMELLETGELDTAALNHDERQELRTFLYGAEDDGKPEKACATQRRETRFDRINRLMKRFSNGRITTACVDTDNHFFYNGRCFEIDPGLTQYAPKHTRYGDQYDMDRIMIIECVDHTLHFADQDAHSIEDNLVYDLGEIKA